MRSILPTALDDVVQVGGRLYRLRPTVWHVMSAQAALSDGSLLPDERARLAVWHLYKYPRPKPSKDALSAAFDLLKEPQPYRTPKRAQNVLSLEQDAALIVAAFRQLYGIDLPAESVRMDWRVFQALIAGITDGTRLGGVMGVRSMELPKRTAHNGEQIRKIQEAKAIYAIRKTSPEQSFEGGLKAMVEILAAMAE